MKIGLLVNHLLINKNQKQWFTKFVDTVKKEDSFIHVGDKPSNFLHDAIYPDMKVDVYQTNQQHWGNNEGENLLKFVSIGTRNKALVENSDLVLCFPFAMNEYEDSPFWRTVNYAVSVSKTIKVITQRGFCYTLEGKGNASD